ncbi:MAG TPA: hypothetical protein VFJ16_25600 [Longimicrobium sp.]|nr:hypothetical protein [Longimicrobium sp.]
MHRFRHAAAFVSTLILLSSSDTRVYAQCEGCVPRPGAARGESVSLGANALIGGATAAVRARLRGRPVPRAFAAGAAGGALTYAGKRIAVEPAEGLGLVGREVAAVGTSFSANAAEGRGIMDRLVLPIGPVRLYLAARGPGPAVSARIDAAAVVAAAYAATVPGARFDADRSLSSGALVFTVPGVLGQLRYDGRHAAGVMLVRRGEDPVRVMRADLHERVHVIQYDQSFLLWSAPAEEALMNRAGWSRALHRWVDLGLNAPALAGVGAIVPYDAQPWETEAEFLSRRVHLPDEG